MVKLLDVNGVFMDECVYGVTEYLYANVEDFDFKVNSNNELYGIVIPFKEYTINISYITTKKTLMASCELVDHSSEDDVIRYTSTIKLSNNVSLSTILSKQQLLDAILIKEAFEGVYRG